MANVVPVPLLNLHLEDLARDEDPRRTSGRFEAGGSSIPVMGVNKPARVIIFHTVAGMRE